MKKQISLEGKRILVTGGATGLGYAITAELRDCGADVIISGRRAELLKKAAAELGASWMQMDISDEKKIPAAVNELETKYGPIYGLVNNAGIQNNKDALTYTSEEIRTLFDTNVFGTLTLTRELAKRMTERGTGAIVFITSGTVYLGMNRNLPYTGTKAALSAMCRALASELSPKGIRVNSIAPGWIETDLVKESMAKVPERRAMVERRSMLGRLGRPEDVGMAAAFLLSDAAAYITAAELKVDGGTTVSL
ncbi:MAG: SDR family oxidoreductase [Treponema sp.]|nr:SDR family oxidoreductase [Treponema sp.]